MFMVAIERGKKQKNMIKNCIEAKQQLTEWVEKMEEGKVKEFSFSHSSFLSQTSLLGGKERLWGFLARVGL